MPSVQTKMTPQKRKADASSLAEPSAQSPSKRARSESTGSLEDLPETWDQVGAADKLLVEIKERNTKIQWSSIEKEWRQSTGEKPAKGVVQDRYRRLRDIRARSGAGGALGRTVRSKAGRPRLRTPNGSSTVKSSSKSSNTVNGASDSVVRERAKPAPRPPRKWKAEREPSEEPLDKSSHESSNDPSDAPSNESSYENSKQSTRVARRKPGGAIEQRMRAGASDGPSSKRMSARKTISARQTNRGDSDLEPSQESNETPKNPSIVAKSAKSSRVMPVVAKDSEEQNTAENANEMLADMREKGHSWPEISKAWTEWTGLTCNPETLRKRFLRSKKGSTTEPKSTIRPTIKRNGQATSPAEVSHESSAKRRKSTPESSSITGTPVKRNMDRGKRKSSVKYTDSTTDEDELFAAPTKPATAATPVKRNARRSAKVDRSDPEWLVTNENSPLANEDLHAEFSDPKTYENFTKSDWEDLRETLPPNVPCNPDGYSIPMTFFKYDPDFRRGIREFQEDLGSGRLDPEWQADAALAMEERARGDFDSYKENEFEAFWGQKQKLKHDALAGESTKIKLELLIQNGLFKVGDSFNYSRVFGRGKNGVLVEKECKIVEIIDKALMFAIPPGQRKYSRHIYETTASRDSEPEVKATMVVDDEQLPNNLESETHGAEAGTTIETDGDKGPVVSQKGDGVSIVMETAQNGHCPEIRSTDPEAVLDSKTAEDRNGEPEQPEGLEVEASAEPQKEETLEVTSSKVNRENGATVQTNGGNPSSAARSENEDTLHEISNLTQLEHKLVDIDGRFQSKEISVQNTWKTFRCSRNNQDMGTLFEIREEFYVYKHPRIVKEAKRKR